MQDHFLQDQDLDQDRPEVVSRRLKTKIKTRDLQHTATQINPAVDCNSYRTVRQREIRNNCDK